MSGILRRSFSTFYPCWCTRNSIKHSKSEKQQPQQMAPENRQELVAKTIKNRLDLQIDWDSEMRQIEAEERQNERSILAPIDKVGKIYAEPMVRPTYNLAAYVQKSETLQQLVKLGVDLSQWDRMRVGQFSVNLDFKADIEPYIIYLKKDIGISIDDMGKLLSKNPKVLQEHLDNIQTRINYLELKTFTRDEIVSIITRNAFWLTYSTRDIDWRLGFLQKHFELRGNEVRTVTISCPRLITHNTIDVEKISFSMREECGFDNYQIKRLVQEVPKLWLMRMSSSYLFVLLN